MEAEIDLRTRDLEAAHESLRIRIHDFEQKVSQLHADIEARKDHLVLEAMKLQAKYDTEMSALSARRREFDAKVISYHEFETENSLLKRDLSNLAVNLRKSQLDGELRSQSQLEIDRKVKELGSRYLRENVKWIGSSLTPSNFASCKQRLLDVIGRCREIGLQIDSADETAYLADLRSEYERVVRAALEREEQARIKAQIREEQQREREVQRELDRIERERLVLETALARALAAAEDEHSAEIEELKARLSAAEASKRAISQAQLTKAGYVYVISNIGSFGEGVYKVGMTRRLVPTDRVRELGDASVPFPFDIHMMISCDDAPSLENAIHRRLLKQQVNKTNPRKEFFRTDIDSIISIVREHKGEVEYVADAEALEYRQSLTMTEEDQEFIEHVFDEAEMDGILQDEEPSIPILP